jgi:hypothetical protein
VCVSAIVYDVHVPSMRRTIFVPKTYVACVRSVHAHTLMYARRWLEFVRVVKDLLLLKPQAFAEGSIKSLSDVLAHRNPISVTGTRFESRCVMQLRWCCVIVLCAVLLTWQRGWRSLSVRVRVHASQRIAHVVCARRCGRHGLVACRTARAIDAGNAHAHACVCVTRV